MKNKIAPKVTLEAGHVKSTCKVQCTHYYVYIVSSIVMYDGVGTTNYTYSCACKGGGYRNRWRLGDHFKLGTTKPNKYRLLKKAIWGAVLKAYHKTLQTLEEPWRLGRHVESRVLLLHPMRLEGYEWLPVRLGSLDVGKEMGDLCGTAGVHVY